MYGYYSTQINNWVTTWHSCRHKEKGL